MRARRVRLQGPDFMNFLYVCELEVYGAELGTSLYT